MTIRQEYTSLGVSMFAVDVHVEPDIASHHPPLPLLAELRMSLYQIAFPSWPMTAPLIFHRCVPTNPASLLQQV